MESDINNSSIKKVILARLGEIALKGLNRHKFESRLIGNIKRKIKSAGDFRITQSQSRIWIVPENEEADVEMALEKTVKVFGLVSASIAWQVSKNIDNLYLMSLKYVQEQIKINNIKTFKIESKRADKNFPLKSPEICSDLGGYILERIPELKVDVVSPDLLLYVEIRDDIYLYSTKKTGHRGLPVGIGGKGLLLLSGGIDSPVAGFMMAGRGLEIEGIYFHSYPYTSDQAKDKVIELGKILTDYTGRLKLHIVNFTDIQVELKQKCPEDMLTIHMRRVMMMIAEKVALRSGAKALITGESLGQVASQTIEALHCTNAAVKIPVFRPLIGLDKEDTVAIARKIGTFETSILPYEDCCTIFVAKHPKTKPTLEYTLCCEKEINMESLIAKGMEDIQVIEL